jgi:hypothetical protein
MNEKMLLLYEYLICLYIYVVSDFQLTNNMNGLEHIIKSETENLQDLTEDAVRHTEEMWTKVTETFNQLQDRGQDFLQSSSTVCSSSNA